MVTEDAFFSHFYLFNIIYPTFKSTKWTFINLQIYQLRHKNALGGARKMTAEGAFLKLVKEFLPFSLHFLPKTPLSYGSPRYSTMWRTAWGEKNLAFLLW